MEKAKIVLVGIVILLSLCTIAAVLLGINDEIVRNGSILIQNIQ